MQLLPTNRCIKKKCHKLTNQEYHFFKPAIAGNTDALPAATAMMTIMITKTVGNMYFTIRQFLVVGTHHALHNEHVWEKNLMNFLFMNGFLGT